MSIMFSIDYFIFSIFLTLFGLETGIAVTLLLEYDKYKGTLKSFLMPLWEITGTFAVFYIVNFEATFPSLLIIVGSAYMLPLLVGAMFFIFRNAFLSYSEYMGNKKAEKTYLHIYALATIVVAFIAISVLDSGISGIGINTQSYLINVPVMFINSFNLLMFVGIALLAVFAAAAFFGVKEYKWIPGAAAPLGIIVIAIAVYSKLPYLFHNAVSFGLPYLIGLLVLLGIAIYAHYSGRKFTRYAVVLWFILAVNFFGFMQQPFLFGGTVNTSLYLPTGSSAVYVNMVTAVGFTILIASLIYFIYITYVKHNVSDS